LAEYRLKFEYSEEFIVLSSLILRGLIRKIRGSPERRLNISLSGLLPESYQDYILRVINSNSEEPYFSYRYIEKIPLQKNGLFRIVQHQLSGMDLNEEQAEERCFSSVRLLDRKVPFLELNCSGRFWQVCRDRRSAIFYVNPDGSAERVNSTEW